MPKYDEWLTDEGLLLVEGWARDGLIDEQIAGNMGISTSTFYEWKNKYSEFSDTLKKGKEVIDRQVESALLKRAMGYSFEEITEESVYNEKKQQFEMKVTKRVTKQLAPDTTAQIFWLKNRKPAEWRDKQDINMTGDLEINITLKDDEE
jgi:transposase